MLLSFTELEHWFLLMIGSLNFVDIKKVQQHILILG